jgi:hypothetical protein
VTNEARHAAAATRADLLAAENELQRIQIVANEAGAVLLAAQNEDLRLIEVATAERLAASNEARHAAAALKADLMAAENEVQRIQIASNEAVSRRTRSL